jgi:hypothetical protein
VHKLSLIYQVYGIIDFVYSLCGHVNLLFPFTYMLFLDTVFVTKYALNSLVISTAFIPSFYF